MLHTLELGRSWFSLRNPPLTPRPKEDKFGSDESQKHNVYSSQRARVPASIDILPRFWHVWVHRDPGACEGGNEAAPDDVPDRSAVVEVGARRRGTIFDDRDRECEDSSEKIESSEEQ